MAPKRLSPLSRTESATNSAFSFSLRISTRPADLRNEQLVRCDPQLSTTEKIAERMGKIEAATGMPALQRLASYSKSVLKALAKP